MPKLTRAERDRLPSTLERSEAHAQEVYIRALESAEQVRGHEGDEQYAHRVAFAAVKHQYEKVGDHWQQKASSGPSDEHAAGRGPSAPGDTAGGVDANATKKHLIELAKQLDVTGRSSMTKQELVEALQKANDRATRQARDT